MINFQCTESNAPYYWRILIRYRNLQYISYLLLQACVSYDSDTTLPLENTVGPEIWFVGSTYALSD